MTTLTTARLRLRPWRDTDLPAYAAITADRQVMEHFPKPLSRAESDAMVERFRSHFAAHGFGFWAVEVPGQVDLIGHVGLAVPRFEAHFMPSVELGWRLAIDQWGKGYATEAASAAVDHAFGALGLQEVVAFTVPANLRSRHVMERLGMRHAPADDFDHPSLPEGHPLRRHVLYRLPRSAWLVARPASAG